MLIAKIQSPLVLVPRHESNGFMGNRIKQIVMKLMAIAQDLGLIVVAVATLIAIGIEIDFMVQNGTVLLTDLLLMFIYLEVLTMVAVYYQSGELPIKFPLYIGIVALARYLILDMKNIDTWRLLGVALAILLLGLSIIVINYCKTNMLDKKQSS